MSLTAGDLMTSTFISVSPNDSPFTAYDAITKHKVHHLPVIDHRGHCVAILDSVTAIARASETLLHSHVKLLELQGVGTPVCVVTDTSLDQVARQMTAAGADACGVVDDGGRMIGIITARDVVAAVAGQRPQPSPPR